MLAVVLPCMLMTYGGISLFVVVFVIYPMGYAIYRAADIPRTKLPGAIACGAGSSLIAGAKTGDYDKITQTGKLFVQRIKEARAEMAAK